MWSQLASSNTADFPVWPCAQICFPVRETAQALSRTWDSAGREGRGRKGLNELGIGRAQPALLHSLLCLTRILSHGEGGGLNLLHSHQAPLPRHSWEEGQPDPGPPPHPTVLSLEPDKL